MNEQISIFDFLREDYCDKKPEIGTRLFYIDDEGKEYPCVVVDHCGYDFFYVRFTDRTPADDNPNYGECEGWHLSIRGFKESWRFDLSKND